MADPRLQKYLDEAEIKDVLVRERYHRDHHEFDDWRRCYHPDPAQTKIKTACDGDIDSFMAFTKGVVNSALNSFHTVTPTVILMNNDKALTKALGTINIRFHLEGVPLDCIVENVMVTQFVRTSEGWRIINRQGINRRDRIVPVTPGEGNLSLIKPTESREPFRNLRWMLDHFGKKMEEELLAFDRPEEVEAFFSKQMQWLHE